VLMCVQSCKSVTKIISRTLQLLLELLLKQEKEGKRKAKKAMELRTRSSLMTQIDLLLITSPMEVEERNSKKKRMTWRGQMMQRYSKSMMKKT
jgi:hypothetical protein